MATATKETSSLSAEDRAKMAAWEMPQVCVGMTVLWYQGRPSKDRAKTAPYAGVITHVGFNHVNICFFPEGSSAIHHKDGVRHADDPKTKDSEVANAGVWDFTDETKAIRHALSS